MKPLKKMIALGIFFFVCSWLVLFAIAWGYDSSNGTKINELMGKIVFEREKNERNFPVLFEWDENRRLQVRNLFEEILWRMPLDVAEIPVVNKITFTNSPCARLLNTDLLEIFEDEYSDESGSSDWLQESRDSLNQALTEFLCYHDNAYWNPNGALHFSGSAITARIKRPANSSQFYFPETVLHEFLHAWEQGNHTEKAFISDKTKPFYDIQFQERSQKWESRKSKIERELEREKEKFNNKIFQDFSKQYLELGSLLHKNEIDEEKYYSRSDELERQLHYSIDRGYDELQAISLQKLSGIYEVLNLPARYAGNTGRVRFLEKKNGGEENVLEEVIDMHPMDEPTEYLAAFVQLLWADPELAQKYYSSEEIAWVQEHVFNGRELSQIGDLSALQNYEF